MKARYISSSLKADLSRKMCFVAGPRQVGKTTMALALVAKSERDRYYNWDDPGDRERILKNRWPLKPGIVVLDEIHKYRAWRNLVKGLFDKQKERYNILVTGSAKLDYYRRGGDSLQGRYYFHRLHPLSVAELGIKSQSDLEALINFSGFPEPFYSATHKEKNRWTIAYRSRLIHEDLVSLEQIADLGTLELLMLRLPELVGSPLSINGLREDLQVSHPTISRWCDVLERMYAIYRIPPFGAPKLRAVKKEQKVYCWDWSLPESPGAKFENFIAGHLLKWCHFMQDTEGREIELRYFRDTDKREVDFVLVERKKPIMFIECKVDQKDSSDALAYLNARFPGVRCVRVGLKKDAHWRTKEGIEVMPALNFLSELV